MTYRFKMNGTCARSVSFDINGGTVSNVKFEGGCSGNTQGVAALAEGMKAEDVIARLDGIKCGFKSTSCPDQLAKAVREAIKD